MLLALYLLVSAPDSVSTDVNYWSISPNKESKIITYLVKVCFSLYGTFLPAAHISHPICSRRRMINELICESVKINAFRNP